MTTTPVTTTTAKKQRTGGIGETLRTIVYAVLIALAVRTFAYEPFNIPSGSMKPTLLVGDYLFVSKFSYGYSRFSFPFSFPPFEGRFFPAQPERGDVIVFRRPDTLEDYIKRLIGLPGDRIQVKGGILHINDVAVERRQIDDYVETVNGHEVRIIRYIETLPNGVEHEILETQGDSGNLDDTRVFTVPEGHYFFMGDNRDDSLDSRTTAVSLVPFENLVGRAEFRWFSLEDASFWEVWKWPTALRLSRMFTGIS